MFPIFLDTQVEIEEIKKEFNALKRKKAALSKTKDPEIIDSHTSYRMNSGAFDMSIGENTIHYSFPKRYLEELLRQRRYSLCLSTISTLLSKR